MALVKCKECGVEISKKAKTCPQCGAPNKKKTSAVTYLVLIVIIVMAFASISTNQTGSSGTYKTPPPASASPSSIAISLADQGKPWSGINWPFDVSKGTLKCDRDAVIFVVDGNAYAVNGTAASRGFAEIRPIWRDNSAIPGTKINIGAVLDPGLDLCR